MRTLVQVVCTSGPSLREAIVKHKNIEDYGLMVKQQRNPRRRPGWAKVRSTKPDRRGALNLEWDADTHILLCRVVNRGKARPNLIIGDFVDYILGRFRARIEAINIIPR